VRIWLALAGILPLLAVGSGATAGTSNSPPQNGLIAVQGVDGIYIVDPRTETARLVPKSEELGDPAWSPDGTTLAVTSSRAGSYDVYTMKPDGNERRLVLRNAWHPSWSPDGKQLVVVRRACGSTDSTIPCSSDEQGGTSLAIVNADGTGVRALGSKESRDALAPEWSPDGKLIAFVDYAGKIKLVTPDGESVPMTAAPTTSASVSWSPDSSKLAYDRYDEKSAGSVVVVVDRASDRETVLRGQQSGAEAPVWSPEGDQLVFNSMEVDRSTASGSCRDHFPSRLWVMALDGTKAHQVGTGYLAYGAASWARAVDSATVLPPIRASTETAPPNPTVTPAAPPTATAAPPATPQPTATATPKRATPNAPPNGSIAVRGEDGIYLVDPDSAKASKVPGTAEMSAPEWSPGMRLLAVEKTEKGGGTSIYTIWPNGSHPQLVLPNASLPSWSPDGDRIFAVRSECTTACEPEDDDANVLYAVNLDGSDVQRVDFEEADVYTSRELAWPTDGSAIHFFDEQSLTGPGSFDSSAAIWSPDGAQLVFAGSLGPADEPGTRKTGLWIVSADGGRPHLLLSGASGRPSWVSS
jgi:Tol biopolymer transport system component